VALHGLSFGGWAKTGVSPERANAVQVKSQMKIDFFKLQQGLEEPIKRIGYDCRPGYWFMHPLSFPRSLHGVGTFPYPCLLIVT